MTRVAAARRHLAATLHVVRAVLRNPVLRRVEIAFLLFNAVEFGTWVAILLYAYATSGPAMVGVVALLQLLPAALVAAVAASAADRLPRHLVLLAGYLVQAAALAATAAGMLGGAPPLVVYVAAAVAASSLTLTRPAQGSLLPALARTPEELTAANGLSGSVEGAGVLLGPLAAAAILAVASPGAVFAAGAAACLLAAALVLRLPRATGSLAGDAAGRAASPGVAVGMLDELPPPSALHRITGGLRALAGTEGARLVVGLLGLRMLLIGALDVLFVLLAMDLFGTGESGAGILNAAFGLGVMVGGAVTFALVGRQRLAPAIAAGAVTLGGALIAIGTIAPAWAAPLVIVIAGVGAATCDVTGRTILQRVTPDGQLARVLGALEGIGMLGLALGSLLVPLLAAVIGIQATLIVMGAVLPASVAVAWAGLAGIDRRVVVPVRELALLRANRVLAPLAAPQLEAVARRTRWITVDRGGVLIREGDPGDRYYVLASGVIRVTQGGRHLRDLTVAGDGLGEIALIRDVPRTATATAAEACVLLALERADFLGAVTGQEQAHAEVRRVAAEREPEPTASGGSPP